MRNAAGTYFLCQNADKSSYADPKGEAKCTYLHSINDGNSGNMGGTFKIDIVDSEESKYGECDRVVVETRENASSVQ